MTDTKWGRKETIVRPPHYPVYSFGAVFISLFVTVLCIYLHFAFAMSPLQRYYVPCYLETGFLGTMRQSSEYQLVTVADRQQHSRPVTEADVQPGFTPQPVGKPIPLALSQAAHSSGVVYLYRGAKVNYQNRHLHMYLRRFVYAGDSFLAIFRVPLWSGLVVFLLQLPFTVHKDVRRLKEMKYGRLLKGPVMVSPKAFNRAIKGDGVGFRTTESKDLMRIPQRAEGQHIELMGDTGTGKTRLIMQLLVQIRERGHSAIVYDPACEFVQRFYDPKNDTILNPLDARCPYWGPSEELRRRAEAKAIAASLYQPTTDKKGEFFTETPQKIFAHLLTFGPSPQELVEWMANPDEIDRRVQNTEMAMMIAKGAQQQRNGVLASLGLIADSLRMLPKKETAHARWSATEWAEERKGWIFITSKPSEREALRPLHSLWIDLLVLRLLNEPKESQHPVWFVLDELASLQRLPQLHTAITENRKSKNPLVLGFQGKAQLEMIYGHLAEVMLSQPTTKIFLRTTEPKAAEWVSNAIGKIEIERLRETHSTGLRAGNNFSLERQVEPLVLDSEVAGLPDRHAFIKLGNHVSRFAFDYWNIPATQPAFVPRSLEDDDLTFEPITLTKKPTRSAPTTDAGVSDTAADDPIETGFSLGD
ncbi:type IV secretion system DNA-binding domain-containing protein [Edaphobacter albus]|uniref:type IV secretion system DNA-binding domain-containing protein n=1 Tax=Edaphobacter sp. 4G125 TaxID=2763071 RepID=UPI0016472515|nr:type IV secretion system DNA-binding domain-containing protein [Edaphobacter sp. 4G125]QNI35863.1 type IV secretion system DNA-binding domain-containing protein [Edaphobacter sp. 4G125]